MPETTLLRAFVIDPRPLFGEGMRACLSKGGHVMLGASPRSQRGVVSAGFAPARSPDRGSAFRRVRFDDLPRDTSPLIDTQDHPLHGTRG